MCENHRTRKIGFFVLTAALLINVGCNQSPGPAGLPVSGPPSAPVNVVHPQRRR